MYSCKYKTNTNIFIDIKKHKYFHDKCKKDVIQLEYIFLENII